MKKIIIVTRWQGQLGNKLFHLAHLISFAKTYNYRIIYIPFKDYLPYFKNLHHKKNLVYPTSPKTTFFEPILNTFIHFFYYRLFYNFFNKKLPLLNIKNKLISNFYFPLKKDDIGIQYTYHDILKQNSLITFVNGYNFRFNEGLIQHRTEILTYFEPLEEHKKNVHIFLQNIKKEVDIIIGVHLRISDMKSNANEPIFDYPITLYFATMRQLIQTLPPNAKIGFVICSNKPINIQIFTKHFNNIYISINHILEDLYLLSQCNYIISNPETTYSRWASYAGGVPLFTIIAKFKYTTNLQHPSGWQVISACPTEAYWLNPNNTLTIK